MGTLKEKGASRSWHYFSETLPDNLGAKVRTISDNGCNEFGTDVLTYDSEGDGTGSHVRLQAWKDVDTGTWTVDKFIKQQGMDKPVSSKTVIMRGANFFDALYYLAYFENTEKSMGASSAGKQGIPHYRQAGEAAGQPFDIEGKPHPAVNGHILTEGTFEEGSDEIAARTKMIESAPVPASGGASSTSLLLKDVFSNEIAPVNEDQVLNKAISQQDYRILLSKLEGLTNAAIDVIKVEREYAKRGEVSAISYRWGGEENEHFIAVIVGAICSAGVLPAAAYAAEYCYDSVRSQSVFNRLGRLTSKIPNGPEKQMMREFNQNARFTLYAERAAIQIEKCVENHKPASKMRKAFPNIEKAANQLNLSSAETQQLKLSFLNRAFKPGDFMNKLEVQRGEVKKSLNSAIKMIESKP